MKLKYKKYGIAGITVMFCLAAMAALALIAGNDKEEKHKVSVHCLPGDAEGTLNVAAADVPVSAPVAGAAATEVTEATTPITKEIALVRYLSSQREGIIGSYGGRRIDNPADNIFAIFIDNELSRRDKVWLSYELEGVEDFTGVPYSVNDRPAKGGCLVKLSDKSSPQRERLNPAWLQKGENRITFTLPEEAGFGYKIKNLCVEVEKNTVATPQLVVSTSQNSYGNKAYIRGFVQGAEGNHVVYLAGEEVQLREGEFEAVIDLPAGKATITATLGNGKRLNNELVYAGDANPDAVFALNDEVQQAEKTFLKGVPGRIELAAAELKIDSAGLLAASKNITLTTLRAIDLPALDMGMSNVTAESGGYRFLPHGEHFAEGATVSIGYDRTKIPDGFTEEDIKTFYFDTGSRHWVALERDSVDKANRLVVSRTTHFTDMINGVIQTPESPETNGFAPTMMKDIKAADPTAKVQVIAPPTANARGSAGLNYVFEMPPARNGMQPGLGIQYNSDGGSGLLGEGWDVTLQTITVDTRWGVPRYDDASETETYLMNGSMLMMTDDEGESAVAHRGDRISRTADRQFYTRQEGGFARIIRKGDNPGNYTWEITDKSGTKYTYGAAGRLIGNAKTPDGQTTGVVSEWRLTRVEELHGDYIDYIYEPADEPVRGSLMAKAIYLTEIRAGNKDEDPHTVVSLVYRGSQKAKKTNSARYGFLVSGNRLLDRVEIRFEGGLQRTYSFDYREGAFHTDILTEVSHLGPQGNLFAKHTMDYYDDVKSADGYQPFGEEPQTWSMPKDNISADFVNPVSAMGIPGFSDEATALGGNKSTSLSGSFYAGVGATNGDLATKSGTVGGSIGYTLGTSQGLSTLVDINGDGLLDKVFKSGESLYYRPNITKTADTGIKYGEPVLIGSINEFSKGTSNSFNYGVSANIGFLGATAVTGSSTNKTTSRTKVYFADVNNDGLIDIVSNGKVYFNHIELDTSGNAVPTFTLNSADTPSPIMGGGVIDASDTEVDPQEQADLIKCSPLLDVVRVWEAPFEGTIIINGDVRLQIPDGEYDTEAYDKADGVRVAIQVGGTEIWSQAIPKGDTNIYRLNPPDAVRLIRVSKGTKVYFRVQSGDTEMANGAFDQVEWLPSITYFDRIGELNPDGLSTIAYSPEDAGFISVENPNYIPLSDSIHVSGHFEKPVTSDDVTLVAVLSNNSINDDGSPNLSYMEQTVYKREFKWDEEFDGEIEFSVKNGIQGENLAFRIETQTNIAFHKVKWNPVVTYTGQGMTMQQPATVYYTVRAVHLYRGEPYDLAHESSLKIKPEFSSKSNMDRYPPNGKFVIAVKNVTGLLAKQEITLSQGTYTPDVIERNIAPAGTIWVECYSDDKDFMSSVYPNVKIMSERVFRATDTLAWDSTIIRDSVTIGERVNFRDTVNVVASTFIPGEDTGFGHMFRGWGQFAYNAAEGRYAHPIDESLLKLPEDEEATLDPLTMAFMPMTPDFETRAYWMGPDPNTFIKDPIMSSSRLGEQDVVLTNPLAGIGGDMGATGDCLPGSRAFGVNLETKSSSSANMYGALGVTYSDAEGQSETILSFSDMNGDGYPDIISKNQIQLTNTRGGFDGEIIKGVGNHSSSNTSNSFGYGGNPVYSASVISASAKYNAAVRANAKAMGTEQQSKAQENEQIAGIALQQAKNQKPPVSVSIDVPVNKDAVAQTYFDINGDGLPDRILADKRVQLNLGYSFSEPVSWDLSSLDAGTTISVNHGLGFDFGASSISAGFGLTNSLSNTEYTLTDVNSDGLPDKVWVNDEQVYVALNKGDGFDSARSWEGLGKIHESASTAEAVNAALTLSFPVFLVKVSLNIGISGGQTMDRPLFDLRDVDGDGFPEIIESESEGEMKVYRSTIARTNKLKTVHNPLGGSFNLDYARSQATYDHPGGKWVMASVETSDGIADDGPDMKTMFEYSGGRRDRHEREFLGFGRVETIDIDTEAAEENPVYRKLIREYDVRSVYTAGNELRTLMEDAEGNKYAESVNEYYSYAVTPSGDNYKFKVSANACTDRAIAFTPLKYSKSVVYEGETAGFTSNETFYEYYLDGYSGELKSYTYSDKGALGSDGTGTYNYRTSIEYTGNAAKHISGLPVKVQVRDNSGTLYRQTEATYDLNYANHITQIAQTLNNQGDKAVTDIVYDSYGNITHKTLPENYKGERMYYRYRYESDYNMYPERIEDAFGYRSEMEEYDYRFGIPRIVRDINGFTQETTIDDMGRITAILAPNEQVIGAPYTIKFEYPTPGEPDRDKFTPLYAVTKHYDPQHPGDDIETVTFVDGLGRAVQVKKDGVVYENGADREVMIVSGRAKFDAFGRVKEACYPVAENRGTPALFNAAFDDIAPTVTGYDILDRATKITLPDGSETTMEYTKDNGERTQITTVTDAEGGRQATFTNGSGLTVKTEQYSGPNGTITTRFEFDPVNQPVKAIDDGGNETLSTYDMAGRRIQVIHPASGKSLFAYDNSGNLLTRQTANLAAEGKFIAYDYEYNRLIAVNYPDHPENNVKYIYGNNNAEYGRKGRVMLQEDGSGAQEFTYDRLGNVASVRRTLIIPNQAIATYVTQWKYDSWNRLEEMIYPDEEKITYSYDTGGLLESVRGEKSYSYNYVEKLGYDKFEQRVYMKYFNGTETDYSYDTQRRRLSNLSVNATTTGKRIMNNAYSYDAVDNVLSVKNTAPVPASGMGGQMSHTYGYDGLYRLVSATGTFAGVGQKTAGYTLEMAYDNLHNITGKKQHVQQNDIQFDGALKAGYELAYHYAGNPFQISTLEDENYRTEGGAADDPARKEHRYEYDANGNLVYVNTDREKTGGMQAENALERKLLWDEENRLEAIDDNGFVSNYWYDAAGERTVKTSGESEQMYVNSLFSGGNTGTADFTAYVNPYLVVSRGGQYTKHIYIGSQRIVSKLGDLESYGADPRRIEYAGTGVAGSDIDYGDKYRACGQAIKDRYAKFGVPYFGEDNNDYVGGGVFGDRAASALARAMAQNDNPEIFQYYYHADHLGSSSLITNLDGETVQHIEYVPFGEVFIEERNDVWNTPYLFNAKELDGETGLYYYGARYYDPRTSLWLSADPSQEKYPNISTYAYAAQNPVKFIDPDATNPVYSSDGTYQGDTKEGFTGEVIIYDGTKDFSKMTASSLLYDNFDELTQRGEANTYDMVRDELSGDAKSKIWTHIVSQMEGKMIYDEKFSMNDLIGGKIHYDDKIDPANWRASYFKNKNIGKGKIRGADLYGSSYETTVENLQSSIIVHEWYSHIKKNQGPRYKSHRLAYKNVINFKRLWNATTDRYKKFNLDSLLRYTKDETGQQQVPPLYRNLYKKYVGDENND